MKRLAITLVAILLSLAVVASMYGYGHRHEQADQRKAAARQADGNDAGASGTAGSAKSAESDTSAESTGSGAGRGGAGASGQGESGKKSRAESADTSGGGHAGAPSSQDQSSPRPQARPEPKNAAHSGAEAASGARAKSKPKSASKPASASKPEAQSKAQAPPPFAPPLHVRKAAVKQTRVLGSDDPKSGYKMRVELTSWGAAVKRANLANYTTTVESKDHYVILHQLPGGGPTQSPFAARWVRIAGQTIPLETVQWKPGPIKTIAAPTPPPGSAKGQAKGKGQTKTKAKGDGQAKTKAKGKSRAKAKAKAGAKGQVQSVSYTAVLVDAHDKPVLRITRTYSLAQGSYQIKLHQRIRNLAPGPLRVRWMQNIQGDLPQDPGAYLGDRRTYATGYFNLGYDPGRYSITTKDAYYRRGTIIKRGGIWPDPDLEGKVQLAWIASENRYFTIATHAALPPGAGSTADVPPLTDSFPKVGAEVFPNRAKGKKGEKSMVFTLAAPSLKLARGGSKELDLAFYAGPRDQSVFARAPFTYLHFEELIRYELGCAWCTFQWLAHALLWFMDLFHLATGDWGIAIIILVAVVRLILHPITKRAQVNMMKMGKQMQTLQPEMEKLKKKYKDDQASLNREMMQLYREKGVNPANVLGCLPMLLQTPIWIALYATLYFAIQLRHEPAFYGFFQLFGNWSFLADLSSPDNFIKLYSHPVPVHLLFINLNFQAVNLFPILMAAVFYLQQKFTTPPPTNDQAASQQKIMKFMVLLFPFFLYGAPSGLTLYILTSTTAGVIDSYLVRKHVQEEEEKGTLFKKKERKPGGMMDRMQQKLQAKQQELEKRQAKQTKQVKSRPTKTRRKR